MTSPNLLRMAKRAELPITVCSGLGPDGACIAITDIPAGGGFCLVTPDDAEATRAYLRLCESLESAEVIPSAATGDGCSAISAPEGGL